MRPDTIQDVHIASLASSSRTADWHLALLHSAPVPRAFWITHGQGRVIVGPRRYGVGIHTFLFVPAHQTMSLSAGAALNGHLISLPESSPIPWPVEPQLLRLRDAASQSAIAAHVEALLRETREALAYNDHAMRYISGLIAIWLQRHLDGTDAAPFESSAADRLIAAFFESLERGYTQGLTLTQYAEKLDVTPTHLSRVCKTQLGESGAALIAQRALHAARTALETGDTPIQTIAASLGFGSPAYFSRFIQAHTGFAPRALRAQASR